MAKYGDLSRGAELEADYQKVLAWQRKTRLEKQTLYASNKKTQPRIKVKRTLGYIRLFNNTTGLLVLEKKVPKATGQEGTVQPNVTQLLSIVQGGTNGAGRVLETAPTGTGIIVVTGTRYKFATLSCISVVAQAEKNSRITGNKYTKIVTDTISTPFGRGLATEEFADALIAIRGSAPYTTFITAVIVGTNATNKVVITPEKA